ncbi:MAG: hypothetical protein UV83_C0006G0019 [candidate division WWE3 bacterium GW2011_GWE2_43_18]|nr:MAG: hypothetical protein UU91_C0008G0032 [candidate division WWE3 bacterium GW2011_GWB1_42_117]KKS54766.1 MAG: hypothetical protein UV21_C0005G0130 [candidate division WWE3 bacterium GW2011_GWD2_42_34]KKT05190.1 MAG: hypothetical protein UV83_C0006G0019 [candidate division WWE3 bacterium GW2011_GWE2_43_18]KKT06457.1 MAG: hypothetical protein UV84_C0007G0019 [candidate division WWE3 bacterium GW2011_GWF2_43_18]KKT08445.1 MAG: hypothetical protein UV87_C0004G0135 [candidate division WWE3 bact
MWITKVANMELEPFKLPALEALAKIIGDNYTGSEISELFRKAGFPEISHDGGTKWRFVYAALEAMQKQTYGTFNIATLIQQLCDPQEYFSAPEKHEVICKQVNQILRFYGLLVGDDGKLRKSGEKITSLSKAIPENAKIFDDRKFHNKISQHARKLFTERNYFHAVFECCKVYDKEIQEKSQMSEYGSRLMENALALTGTLKLNAQQTRTEKNEQEGVMHLSVGLMRAIRNPQAHEPALDWPINREEALDLLSFLNFLFKKIDKVIYFNQKSN